MATNFYIWTLNLGQQNACSYYRIAVPMNALGKQDYANVYEETGSGRKDADIALMYADIAHFYGIQGEQRLHDLQTLRRITPSVRDGKEIFPPALIYDIDDNLDFIHPFNTTFAHMGVRSYPDAKILEPGDCITFEDSEGKPLLDGHGNPMGWYDGESFYEGATFNVARNLQQMKVRHEIMRTAHGITVPSPTLARYMRDVVGNKNVHVYPNSVVPGHFEKIRAIRTDPKVRILWQGGMSHWIDWYPLREALKTIAEKYKDKVTFVIFGEWFNWIHESIPDTMVEHHPWVEYAAYKLKRGLLNCDINLCPLANNMFNACKSAIKWYEASVWETPEATLAAKTATYSEMVDGETGLTYSTPAEFVEKLSLLIEDASLRARVADGARRWVLENRTPEATIPALFDFYAETRARQRRELGKPILHSATLEQIKKVARPMR